MLKYWPEGLPEPSSRTAADMENVLAVRPSNQNPETELYFMYRDLYKTHGDRLWLQKHHLRYDITRIPPGIINGEYVKTKGHYHPCNKNGVPYPEVYEVLSGYAYYLLQKRDHTDVIILPARTGDVVLIPPGYGHVTINPAKEELVMANLVSTDFASEYGEINDMHGAAYYYMKKDGWVFNEAYGKRIPMHIILPKPIPELGLTAGRSLYDMVGSLDTLAVMNHPEDFEDVIEEFFAEKKDF
ncbi:MAG TPA: glucose-6-phosphate isomerase [Methanocorpusculum sp.]|nr:glucose-6-phosphate isomerase [Methanocorpusculum sp.]